MFTVYLQDVQTTVTDYFDFWRKHDDSQVLKQ